MVSKSINECPASIINSRKVRIIVADQVDIKKLKFQTDNGSEFIGCFREDRSRDGFEKVVQGFGSIHKRIPPRAWSYNSDVETVHSTIELEFYDMENFEGVRDFHQRIASYSPLEQRIDACVSMW